MKRTLIAAAMGLIVSGLMMAQGQFGPRGDGGAAQDPATRIANQVARLTTLLDLTSSQASQIRVAVCRSVGPNKSPGVSGSSSGMG